MDNGKLIIFSAPSGSGKSTLIQHILQLDFDLKFSISATSRLPRGTEVDGVDYFFFTSEKFKEMIINSEFVEYEEVYAGCYYGTLRSEIDRITNERKNIIFDVDVVGGLRIKEIFQERALCIFVAPPSIDELKNRLISRATDSLEMINRRIDKAELELSYASKFDLVIVNDDLETAKCEVELKIREFLNKF